MQRAAVAMLWRRGAEGRRTFFAANTMTGGQKPAGRPKHTKRAESLGAKQADAKQADAKQADAKRAESPASRRVVYLDANASALMPQAAIDAMVRWTNRGNSSAAHAGGREARQMLADFREAIAAACGFAEADYDILFTSGASESNAHIVTAAVRRYAAMTRRLPHVVTSITEHRSLLACCRALEADGLCQLTVLGVRTAEPGLGLVDPASLERALRPNTCLVTIMAANNETGALNEMRALADILARQPARRVPFHSDIAQLLGRLPFRLADLGVDAFSASFHKLGGPPGVGVLVMRRDLVEAFKLGAHIHGAQNGGLRGGTENLPGIGASAVAFRLAMSEIANRAARTRRLRNALRDAIAARLPCAFLGDVPADRLPSIDGGITPPGPPARLGTATGRAATVVWLAPQNDMSVLPNTLLLAVNRPGFCGEAARAALERRGFIVALGAACAATEQAAGAPSDGVAAIGLPVALRSGVLRVSLAADTSAEDVASFARALVGLIEESPAARADQKRRARP